MSLKVVAERDILSVLSVLTREGEESSFLLDDFARVYERSRLFEVLNDVAFRIEENPALARELSDDGRRSEDTERKPQPEAGELRGGEAAVAAEGDDGNAIRRATVRRHLEQKRANSRRLAHAKVRSRKRR